MEKDAVTIVNEWLKEKYGEGAMQVGGVTRNPNFKGTEEDLAKSLFEEIEFQIAKTPEQKSDEQWETIYDLIKDALLETRVEWDKEYSVEELKTKLSNIFCDLDMALLHLPYFMPRHIKTGYKERSEAKKIAQEKFSKKLDNYFEDNNSFLDLVKNSFNL